MKTHSKHFIDLPNGKEVEVPHCDAQDVVIEELADGSFAVAYLVHDESCESPLEDSACNGAIYFHPNARYSSSSKESDFYEALGLNSDGEPGTDDVEDSDVEMLEWALEEWIQHSGLSAEQLEAVHPLGVAAWLADYAATLTSRTENEACNWAYMQPESESCLSVNDLMKVAKYRLADSHLYWADVEAKKAEVAKARYELPDDVAVLDAYIHGGIALSLSGGGVRCRWDTSSGIAVWKAEGEALNEVKRRQVPYQIGYIQEAHLKGGGKFNAVVSYAGVKESSVGLFPTWGEAYKVLEELHELFLLSSPSGITEEMVGAGRRRAVDELASNAIEQWNAWANGDCWGVVSLTCTPDGEADEEYACWGFVGHEWAEQELAYRVEWERKEAVKRRAAMEGVQV